VNLCQSRYLAGIRVPSSVSDPTDQITAAVASVGREVSAGKSASSSSKFSPERIGQSRVIAPHLPGDELNGV
jgi:hypothetical protein